MLALLLYGVLAFVTARQLGVVGEVAIAWSMDAAPAVLIETSPPLWADGATPPTVGHTAGPLIASQVRPVERLMIGDLSLPIAVNRYTGGPPDWPARLLFAATGSVGAVLVLHVLLGGLLIVLVHRFLRFHGTDVAAAIAALMLASDWRFIFYRRALGGTEIALQAALLLILWALWSRRWAGGRHGLTALGIGVGLGLMAKLTFVLPLAGLFAAALVTRWDRPAVRPPLPGRLHRPLLAVLLLTAPLWVTAIHHGFVPTQPHIRSHDFPDLQWQRVLDALSGGGSPVRESLANLMYWAGDPLAFFSVAYDSELTPRTSPWRVVGWVVLLAGVVVGWRDRHPTPHTALLRFMSVLVPLQVGALWLVARDLHHLVVTAPMVAILAGLSINALAGTVSPPRGFARARIAFILALPWIIVGVQDARRTDVALSSVSVVTFTEPGQQALLDLLREHDVQRLGACDYELYGVLETRAPDIAVIHGWGAASLTRGEVLPGLLAQVADGHFLVINASAPMIYNLRPSLGALSDAAGEVGLVVGEVGRIEGAVLYRVGLP
ncbi:MAG: hypothetical protein ACI8RZ_001630 [Myxococcota bacterium]